jgi:hypothetical protein
MSFSSRLIWIGLGALALAGCERASEPVACTPEFRAGVQVNVLDSITGAPPESASLIVRSGAYVDSVGPEAAFRTETFLSLGAAGERVGIYNVMVRSPGYLPWTRTGVQVIEEGCHVRTVNFTALMQK